MNGPLYANEFLKISKIHTSEFAVYSDESVSAEAATVGQWWVGVAGTPVLADVRDASHSIWRTDSTLIVSTVSRNRNWCSKHPVIL